VDYYATFDSYEVGAMQGGYIEETLGLENNGGPFTIEIFAGSPDDNNSKFLYDGAMGALRPYIDDGRLIVGSGEIDAAEVSIKGWDWKTAQDRMERLLDDHYADGKTLHAILSPNDGLAIGIINALKKNGYGNGKTYPLLTGQDCALENVVAMLNGEQSMSVFKDTRILADRTVRMIDDLLLGKPAEVNDDTSCDNGVKIVPAYMCKPIFADGGNYKHVLIDSGYYDEADLK
jgi:putative multiple sugar transport system substrate-binding protein